MKIENVVFWLLVVISISIIIWMLIGSPETENAIFFLILLIITQVILLWKEFYTFKAESRIGRQKLVIKLTQIEDKLKNVENNLIGKRK